MKYQNTRRGFTLIELLVVVLIIGILAAVALPQYRFAVEKVHASDLLATLKTIYKLETVYYLQHGVYTQHLQELDATVDRPIFLSMNSIGPTLISATDFVQFQIDLKSGATTCWAIEDTLSQRICANFGTRSTYTSSCTYVGTKKCYGYTLR